LDYGAAKGHKGLAALAKELEPWTKEDKLDGSPKRGTGSRSETAKSFPPAWVELGRVYLLLGEGPKALEAAQRGAELLPDEPEAQSALGVAWMATGHVPEASKALQKAVELDPGNAVRRGNWGTVLLLQGQVAEALEQYEIQVELAPSDPFAHGDLGTSLLALGDPSQFVRATQELERAVALEPNRATFRTNLGYAYTLQKRNTEALASHREAVRLDPNLASAWINLATVLATDPASRLEARKALERARVLDPTDPRLKPNFEELDALEGRPKAGVR
jgi:Flp pilus assembly protein TadD